MKHLLFKIVLAGLAGGIVLNVFMLLTFRLIGFGWHGGGILLDPSIQSQKLISVWTQIEPIPRVVSNPGLIIVGLILFSMGHALIYRWLAPAWPPGILARGWRMAVLIFFLSFLFWEFFTPYNLFGEPVLLIGLEVLFWSAIAMAEAFAIAAMWEWKLK